MAKDKPKYLKGEYVNHLGKRKVLAHYKTKGKYEYKLEGLLLLVKEENL